MKETKKEKNEFQKSPKIAFIFANTALAIILFLAAGLYLNTKGVEKFEKEIPEKESSIIINAANFEDYRNLLLEDLEEKIVEYQTKCTEIENSACVTEEDKTTILDNLTSFQKKVESITVDNVNLFESTKLEVENYFKELEGVQKEDESSSLENSTESDKEEEKNMNPDDVVTSVPTPSATPKPSTTPKPIPSSTPKPSTSTQNTQDTSSLEKVLNNAKLSPLKTGYQVLDDRVEEVLKETTTSSMTTYQKVKAVYDWVINNMSYQLGFVIGSEIDTLVNDYGFYENDAIEVFLANNSLATKTGSCDNYSAIFMIIMRRIGLDSYTVGARNKDGSGHTTVNIKIDGTWYNFDTQGDDNSQKNGKIMYYYFGKTDSESSKLYTYVNRESDVSKFKKFAKQQSALSITIEVLGKKYSAKAVKQNDYISEVIDVDYSKVYPVPIKIEASEEVNYKWISTDTTHTYYNWGASTIKGQGTMKSGELEFGYDYATRRYMLIHFTDSKGRELNFLLRFNFRDTSKELSLKIGDYSNYTTSWYDFNVYGLNGTGELTYSAKLIDTNDPQGISSIKVSASIPEGSAYTNFQLTNINWEKYYYTVEVSVTDASGKTVTTTTTQEAVKKTEQ